MVSLISHFFCIINVHLLYINFTQKVRDRRDRSEVRELYHLDILICACIFGMIEDCSGIFRQNGNWSLRDIIKMCCAWKQIQTWAIFTNDGNANYFLFNFPAAGKDHVTSLHAARWHGNYNISTLDFWEFEISSALH